jgi:hypothetical protein
MLPRWQHLVLEDAPLLGQLRFSSVAFLYKS